LKKYLFLSIIAFVLFLSTASTVSTSSPTNAIIIRGNGHAPVFVSNGDNGVFDFNNDGLTDYYVKAHYTGNDNQMYKIDIKVRDSCVDGSTYENATMKLGFTNQELDLALREWFTDGFNVWNPWFRSARSSDPNNAIDLVSLPFGVLPISYPETGDDLIQKNPKDKVGSFNHVKSMRELDRQDGWKGSFFINPSIESYFMWSIFPAEGSVNDKCDTVAAIGISSTVIARTRTIS
jgi:hypothetical protein